jgi:mannose/cellobiose epimerase-like protein (N-acyl-D-glucosamine 2-epimerase family)
LDALATHGVQALRTTLFDGEHGGWFAAVDADGPVDDRKQAYGHAFVVLAASSATVAGVPAGAELLEESLSVVDDRFWDEDIGMVAEEWDRAWSVLEDYRGVNANMHTVEAYLAAGDVTGDPRWHARAGRIAVRVAAWARETSWRVPEHFDAAWTPLLEHNRDEPAHPFRPYGATVGHGLEWARLLVAVAESLGARAPAGLTDAAVALFDRAVADGWAVDGRDGFVYTTDWHGRPVVRSRMHWVVAEALNTSEVLHRATGDARYAEDNAHWWAYADRYLIDRVHGSWHHELDEENRPGARVWSGKPDVYHAYQAAVLPSLPTTPSFATALARVGLR